MSRIARTVATIDRMVRRPARSLVIGVAAGLTAIGGACGGSSHHSSATSTTSAGRTFQVNTPEGQASLSLDGRLPVNWPQGFPVPSGATPAGSGSVERGGSGTRIGVYSTGASGPDTFAFYTGHTGLSTSGAKSFGAGSSYVGTASMSAPYAGSLTVLSHSGRTYIVAVLTGSTPTDTTSTAVTRG